MRRPSLGQITAGISFAATFVAVVATASCGSNNEVGLGDGGGNSSGSANSSGGASSGTACTSGSFCTPTSSGGGNSDASFGSGGRGDSGVVTVIGTTSLVKQTNCPSTLAASMVTALEAAPASEGGMKMLYPYNATVFPGGIPSPVLQWSQTGTPDGVYVHLTSTLFNYQGCFAGASPTNLTLDETAWATAWAQSKGKSDPLTVEIATSTGGTISSVTTQWIFAKGSLAGDTYYNTYGSKLVPGQAAGGNGAVMRIGKGATQPTAFLYTMGGVSPLGPCVSCHSLSANGSYLVAQEHFYPGGLFMLGSMSFDLLTDPMPVPTAPLANDATDDWGFSGVYPDGTFLLTSGEPQNSAVNPVFPGVPGNNPGMIGPKISTIYSTKTGAASSPNGLTASYAMMPSFSVDGSMVVYNDGDDADASVPVGGKLVTQSFSETSMTFSNSKTLFTSTTLYPGWPFFTPDNKDVIFALGNGNNYATEVPPTPTPNQLWNSYLYIADVTTGTSHRLDQASGFTASGSEYLPFPGRDEDYDFYPTINPIASGGYFWVYFTSRRAYGNVYQGTPSTGVGGNEGDPGTKAIWVTAIDIAPAAGTDPSHPAFFLPGQEVGSGNIRAFPVLAPCSGNGATCESGLDCCGGSCTAGACGVPAGCANDSDHCSSTIPCCDHTEQCLGGYCSQPTPN